MAETINIYGRIHSMTSDGIVTNTNELYDIGSGKKQSEVNAGKLEAPTEEEFQAIFN